MSNFIVSPLQINSLVKYYAANMIAGLGGSKVYVQSGDLTQYRLSFPEGLQALTRRVVAGNISSNRHRYPREKHPNSRQVMNTRQYKPLTAVQAIKLAQCLKYNSSEHHYSGDECDNKRGRALQEFTMHFCKDVINVAINNLDGYDAAPWTI